MGNPPGFLDTIRWCPRCGRQKAPDGVGDLKMNLVAYSYLTTKGANSNSQSRNIPSYNHFGYFNRTFSILGDLDIFSLLPNLLHGTPIRTGQPYMLLLFFSRIFPDIFFVMFPLFLFSISVVYFFWYFGVLFRVTVFFVFESHCEEESQGTRKLFV